MFDSIWRGRRQFWALASRVFRKKIYVRPVLEQPRNELHKSSVRFSSTGRCRWEGENLHPSVLNSQVQRCPVTIYRIYRLPGREEFCADHDLPIRRAGPP